MIAVVVALSGRAVLAAGGGTDEPGRQALEEGNRAFDSGEFAVAEEKYNAALSQNDKLNDAYWKLASILYNKKKYGEAVALLRRAPEQKDSNVKEQLGLALYKTAKVPPPEAVHLLEQVVGAHADAFAAQGQLAQYYLNVARDGRKAAVAAEAYLKYRKADASALDDQFRQLLGTAYLVSKQWDEAVRVFEGGLKYKPNDPLGKIYLGTALVGKGDVKSCSQAINIFESQLKDATKQPSIYFNLGKCYLRVGRFADAEREANAYVRAKGSDAKGHVLLGDALFEQGRYDQALRGFQTARNLDRSYAGIVARIGKTDVKLKNYDAAIAELEEAGPKGELKEGDEAAVEIVCAEIEAFAAKKNRDKLSAKADRLAPLSRDPKALRCAATAYYQNGADEKALTTLQAALTLDPNAGQVKSDLVRVYNRLAGKSVEKSELGKAQSLLVDAERLQADNVQTNRNLGLVYLLARKCGEAEASLGKALKKSPNDIATNRLLGRTYLCLAKRKDARAAYEKAAQIALRTRGVDLANVWTELGPLYAEDGQLDQAVTVLETAVKEAVGSTVHETAQRNLAIAYLQRGIQRLTDNRQPADGALDDILKAANSPKGTFVARELTAIACYEGAASLRANKFAEAQDAWSRAVQGGGCQLKPPWDKGGADFWTAYAGYRDAGNVTRREGAVKKFQQLLPRVSGALAENVKILIRSGLELLGYDYFQKSDEKRAEVALKAAFKTPAKSGGKRELDNNIAAVDMMLGRAGQAEKAFDALSGSPPESLVNLGILKEKAGDGKAALGLYRQALQRGARSPKVKEWVDVLQRFYGGEK